MFFRLEVDPDSVLNEEGDEVDADTWAEYVLSLAESEVLTAIEGALTGLEVEVSHPDRLETLSITLDISVFPEEA